MFQTFLRRSLIPQITDLQRVLMANGLHLPLFVLVIFMSLGWGERVLFIFSSAAAFKGLSQQVNSSSMTYSRGSSWCFHILCAGIEVLHLFVICLPEQHYHVERLCRSYIAACLFFVFKLCTLKERPERVHGCYHLTSPRFSLPLFIDFPSFFCWCFQTCNGSCCRTSVWRRCTSWATSCSAWVPAWSGSFPTWSPRSSSAACSVSCPARSTPSLSTW